ncbi:MAG: hypothetical protein VX899_11695 [Myxococcota bacterium]|nr:hypothetical protein [Myxococcota bacterium]
MPWLRSDNTDFSDHAKRQPGWYWVLRPRQVGPRAYDARDGVLCLVLAKADGSIASPLADLRELSEHDLTCVDDDSGARFPTWFFGPVTPGAQSAVVTASESGAMQVEGSAPSCPGWHWVRTNDEAPLMLVDEQGIGPIFLIHDDAEQIQVYLAQTVSGEAVDVGEFAFAEPLVSEGGVIDASGSLGRVKAFFHGALPVPAGVPDTLGPRG